MHEESPTLTDEQRERLVTDLVDGVTFALEQQDKSLTDAFEEYDDEDIESAADLHDHILATESDDELVDDWLEALGPHLDELANQRDGEFATAWEDADVAGVTTPAHWQLEKLLNDEETDYQIPTLGNVLSDALSNAESITFSHARLDYLLEVVGMTTDDDGFIIDAETGEYKVPYGFDAHGDRTFLPFRDLALDTEDDPLDERLAEMREESDKPHLHYADRIHVEDFGGILPEGVLPETDEPQVLRDNWFEMLELAGAGALTKNLKGISPKSPVLTTSGIHTAYTQDADAMFETDTEDADNTA